MKFRRVFAQERPALDFSGSPSLARQEFLHDSDINSIVKRFLRSGVLPQPNLGRPVVDGCSLPGDFTEASNAFFEAQREQSNLSSTESASNISSTESASNISSTEKGSANANVQVDN